MTHYLDILCKLTAVALTIAPIGAAVIHAIDPFSDACWLKKALLIVASLPVTSLGVLWLADLHMLEVK